MDPTALNILGLIATAILGFWLNAERADKKLLQADIAAEKAARLALELKVAETYVLKADLKEVFKSLNDRIAENDKKLEEIKSLMLTFIQQNVQHPKQP